MNKRLLWMESNGSFIIIFPESVRAENKINLAFHAVKKTVQDKGWWSIEHKIEFRVKHEAFFKFFFSSFISHSLINITVLEGILMLLVSTKI